MQQIASNGTDRSFIYDNITKNVRLHLFSNLRNGDNITKSPPYSEKRIGVDKNCNDMPQGVYFEN